MADLATIKTFVRTETGITTEALWTSEEPIPVADRASVVKIVYWAESIVDNVGSLTSVPIYVQHLNNVGGTETAWIEADLTPPQTDAQRFFAAAQAWVDALKICNGGAHVAAEMTSHGDDWALGWSIHPTLGYRTAALYWADASKTLPLAYTVGVPLQPADAGAYMVLANGATAMAFADGQNAVRKVTPTASATYTTTVPPAGSKCTLIVLTSGTTAYTITFGAGFKTTGTLATGTTSGRVFTVPLVSDGTNLLEDGARSTAMAA